MSADRVVFWVLIVLAAGLIMVWFANTMDTANTIAGCALAEGEYRVARMREDRHLTAESLEAAALASLEVERWCGAQRLAEIDAELDAQP